MKTTQIFTHALVLVVGILIGTFFINRSEVKLRSATTIPAKEAKEYFANYLKLNPSSGKSGYFDISRQTLKELNSNMKTDNARIYFGESANPDDLTTYLLMNDVNANGQEEKSDSLKLLKVTISKDDCPKYCDFNQTYLWKL